MPSPSGENTGTWRPDMSGAAGVLVPAAQSILPPAPNFMPCPYPSTCWHTARTSAQLSFVPSLATTIRLPNRLFATSRAQHTARSYGL